MSLQLKVNEDVSRDTGACCVIDNSGENRNQKGVQTSMSNFEGNTIRATESRGGICMRTCDDDKCEDQCERVEIRHSHKKTGKENFLGNAGLKVLSGSNRLFIFLAKDPFLVIG